MSDDWRCDQYRWVNNAVIKLPRKNPTIKKTYYHADTPNGPSREFVKQAHELVPSNGNVLIHYIGNEKTACDFAHGNAKLTHADRGYVRTCLSAIKSLEKDCNQSTTERASAARCQHHIYQYIKLETRSKLKTCETSSL